MAYDFPIKIKLMNLNELNYYHRNPFYQQDFIPDRAWYNREAKQYPSQIPSGKDFLPSDGRKHYPNKSNHSEIKDESILISPERYPFQNKIALNKTYMRSLNTIDIQGASSNTRVNQSIKNKYKARDQINRQFRSVQMKEKTEEEKRREAAVQYYHALRKNELGKSRMEEMKNQSRIGDNRLRESTINPEKRSPVSLKKDLSDQYKKFIMHNSSNKFHKDTPIVRESPHLPKTYNEQYRTLDHVKTVDHVKTERDARRQPQPQTQRYQEYPYPSPAGQKQSNKDAIRYHNQLNPHKQYSDEYQKILTIDQEINRSYAKKPSDVRKRNPTNLSISFNLAGQSVVAN